MVAVSRIAALALCSIGLLFAQATENWPHWRGPNLNGTSTTAHDLPTTWDDSTNVVWKTKLPSWGASTPIIWNDYVFVTSAEEGFLGPGGGRAGEASKDKVLLVALDRSDGSIRWSRVMGEGNHIIRKSNLASASPLTDGKNIWTVTGQGVLACWDFEGNKLWERNLARDYGKVGTAFGYNSSPQLHDGNLYLQMLHGYYTDEPSYVLSINASTGKTRWRVERPTDGINETPDSYSTPTFGEVGGKLQFLVSGGGYVTGHDMSHGKELWRRGGLDPNRARDYRTIASPLRVGDMLFVPSRRKPFIAFRLGSSPVRVWTTNYGPDVPTPTSDGERLYLIDDRGIAQALDLDTGDAIWERSRLQPGTYSSSPVLADGKIYVINEDAVVSVLETGPEFNILAVNQLEGFTLSSPAVSGNQLFFRTSQFLYCISASGD